MRQVNSAYVFKRGYILYPSKNTLSRASNFECKATIKVLHNNGTTTYIQVVSIKVNKSLDVTCNNLLIADLIFRQIICWQSRGTTTVTEVKLHYFRGRGSTMAVAVKIQVQLKKLRIAKFIQKWKKKNLLPPAWYYHGHGSTVISLPSPWQYRGSTCT